MQIYLSLISIYACTVFRTLYWILRVQIEPKFSKMKCMYTWFTSPLCVVPPNIFIPHYLFFFFYTSLKIHIPFCFVLDRNSKLAIKNCLVSFSKRRINHLLCIFQHEAKKKPYSQGVVKQLIIDQYAFDVRFVL
jgi:hypothetical protein